MLRKEHWELYEREGERMGYATTRVVGNVLAMVAEKGPRDGFITQDVRDALVMLADVRARR